MNQLQQQQLTQFHNPNFGVSQVLSFENLCIFDPNPLLENGEPNPYPMAVSGFKTIKIINFNKFKQSVIDFKRYKDLTTNTIWGIPIKKNADGTYEFKRIHISESKTFDCSNLAQAMEFHIARYAPMMQNSPFNFGGERATYYVHDEEAEAIKKLDIRKQSRIAEDFIETMDSMKLKDYGRIFNFDPIKNSDSVIKNYLVEIAIKTPEKINRLIRDGEATQAVIVYRRCKSLGLITEDINSGIKTSTGMVLGLSELSAIQKIKEDKSLLRELDVQSKNAESRAFEVGKNIITKETAKTKMKSNASIDAFLKKNSKDFEKQLEKEMKEAELEEKRNYVSEDDLVKENSLSKIIESNTPDIVVDPINPDDIFSQSDFTT